MHDAAAPAAPGARLAFDATAYCKGMTTRPACRRGPASRPPIRRCCRSDRWSSVDAADEHYNGIYTVMDTGPAVQGRQIDIYMWSCNEALQFGRRPSS